MIEMGPGPAERHNKALAEMKRAVAAGIAKVDAGNVVPYDMGKFREEASEGFIRRADSEGTQDGNPA